MSWLEFALNPFPDLFAAPPGGVSAKVKDALLNKRFTDPQIGVAYDRLCIRRRRRSAGLRAYVARVERLYPGPSEVRLPPYRYRP